MVNGEKTAGKGGKKKKNSAVHSTVAAQWIHGSLHYAPTLKECSTSNSKAGPTLTFYIRSGPVRAVSVVVVVVVAVVVAVTYTTNRRHDAYTHTHTRTNDPTAARYMLRECLRPSTPVSFGDRCRARRRAPTATSSFTIRRCRTLEV